MKRETPWRVIAAVDRHFECWHQMKDGITAVKKRQLCFGVAVAVFVLFTIVYSFKPDHYISACNCNAKPMQANCRLVCVHHDKESKGWKIHSLLPVNKTFEVSNDLQPKKVLSNTSKETDKHGRSSPMTVSRRIVDNVTTSAKEKENTSTKGDNHHNKARLKQTTVMQAATLRTTTTGPEIVRNIENCNGCLTGKVLISVQKGWICGGTRLGNKLSMMAAAIGAAAKSNMTFVIVKGSEDCGWINELQSLFVSLNSTVPVLPYSMMSNWPAEGEPGFTAFQDIKYRNKNFTIAGYRQTWRYFSSDTQKAAVRNAYRFTPTYEQYAHHTLLKIGELFKPVVSQPIFIALHMRIGDIVGSTYGYQMANKTFYDHVLTVVSQRFPKENTIYVVASDSPDYGRRMLKDAQRIYNMFWLRGSAFEDFTTLAHCNHSVISGGTYGFWAGWLAGGEVFYFANFSKIGTAFHQGFNGDNFYDPSWVPVSWH